MRLGTKILLMMLLITVGTSAALAWIVTLNVRAYETRRANDKVTEAIAREICSWARSVSYAVSVRETIQVTIDDEPTVISSIIRRILVPRRILWADPTVPRPWGGR